MPSKDATPRRSTSSKMRGSSTGCCFWGLRTWPLCKLDVCLEGYNNSSVTKAETGLEFSEALGQEYAGVAVFANKGRRVCVNLPLTDGLLMNPQLKSSIQDCVPTLQLVLVFRFVATTPKCETIQRKVKKIIAFVSFSYLLLCIYHVAQYCLALWGIVLTLSDDDLGSNLAFLPHVSVCIS